MDAPPDHLTIGGADYPIATDFRVWLAIGERVNDLYAQPRSRGDALSNLRTICDMEALAFGGVLEDEDPYQCLAAMLAFLRGYPEPPIEGTPEEKAPVYSFDYDLNYIVLAIRNQGGPDLSYRRRGPFHWWEFLLEFRSLCGDHYILRLMDIRGYEDDAGKDAHREAMRLKRRYALPPEMTADQRRAAEEFEKMTGG